MKKKLSIFLAALIFILGANQISYAGDFYSWEDAKGNKVYGSKPPSNAKDVVKLKSRPLSRYSSDKVLKGAGVKNPQAIAARDIIPPAPPRSSQSTASLAQASMELKQDESERVTSLSVALNNTSPSTAESVYVSFEFPDGSLLPAVGPENIPGNSQAKFSLPSDLLPFSLRRDPADPNKKIDVTPKVIVESTNAKLEEKTDREDSIPTDVSLQPETQSTRTSN